MKTLVISLKTPSQALDQFATALKDAHRTRGKVKPHYEIAFDNKRDFERFVSNISVLIAIQSFHPESVTDLSKLMNADYSNLSKIIHFYEEIGAIQIEERKLKGRTVRIPKTQFSKVEFDLNAA